jgi:hypothetical protein
VFCPKCKSEYKEGFLKCAECGVDLVEGHPPEAEDGVNYVEMVEVFSTYNQGDIALVKSALDSEGIHYFFSGESTIMMIGAGSYARLLVKADEAERAREILQELGFLERG